jgi:hypothetical protein
MLRTCVCAALALVLVAGISLAEEAKAKKGKIVIGKFVSYKDGTLTINVKKKGEETKMEFKIADETKVVIFAEGEKTELTGKDAQKIGRTKEGTRVAIRLGKDDAVMTVLIGNAPKKGDK